MGHPLTVLTTHSIVAYVQQPEEILFTDGCCCRHPTEGLKTAFSVVRQTEVSDGKNQQLAEVQGTIKTLEWSEGKSVTSTLVGATQVDPSQWVRSGFLMAGRTPIKHEKDIKKTCRSFDETQGTGSNQMQRT